MNKANKVCIIISAFVLILPIIEIVFSIKQLLFPKISFVAFKGSLMIIPIVLFIIIIVISFRNARKTISIVLVVANILLGALPYMVLIFKNQAPLEAPIVSETKDIENYLILDEYQSEFFYKDLIYSTFPDLNEEKINIKSYSYLYAPGAFSTMDIIAIFDSYIDFFPFLINKIELAGLRKIPDNNCYAHFQNTYAYPNLYFDVKFNYDGTICYYYSCTID